MSRRGYPYIPNSDPAVQAEMLKFIGVGSIDELIKQNIPDELLMKGDLQLPQPFEAECNLVRHVSGILEKNRTAEEMPCFLGAGCYNRYVPAMVDEVINRSEFLTAYAGEPYEDHGRFQACFEYESMMAELLDCDVVNVPNYDGAQAAGTALRMATRVTRRDEVLVTAALNPDVLRAVRTYLQPDVELTLVDYDKKTGRADLADLKAKLSGRTAAVLLMNPNFLGIIEEEAERAAELAHGAGALFLVYADPATLGVMKPPFQYGADLACGDIQGLGIHMNYGGGVGGYMAAKDRPEIVREYPSRLFGLAPTSHGEWGFGDVLWERTSFAERDHAKEFVGTHAALWSIGAAVYLASLGPQGMRELGQTILQLCLLARRRLASVPGLTVCPLDGVPFQEFTVRFERKTAAEVNAALLERSILGGYDLSGDFPELGQCMLLCVTERTTEQDIDALASALKDILK
ncbi:MAG: aminomethyl-transferring glycine dehydrogenase subunit GcvPA [Fretibacterium sp.]|nr:aminomethyl-transferring glycine dehydrogenase subunit GcvPA [Fretibacterium sp.]